MMEITAVTKQEAKEALIDLGIRKKIERVEDPKYSSNINKLAFSCGYKNRNEKEAFRELIKISEAFKLEWREYKGVKYQVINGWRVV